METQPKVDLFAQIATQRESAARAALVEPTPPSLPDRTLPFAADGGRDFRPAPKIGTEADLQAELERQRRRFEPFMRDLAPPIPATRDLIRLDTFDWRVETESDCADFTSTLAGAGAWTRVQIPHYGAPLGRAVTYYRTEFQVTDVLRERGRLFVHFKGVDYKAHVFVNGAFLGSHEGFFAPFEFDFTPHARTGTNVLLVKVENDAICLGNGSWGANGDALEGDKIYAATGPGYDEPVDGWHHCPPGMGIYQDVRIEARAPLHIHDVFVRPLLEEGRAEAWIDVWSSDVLRKPVRVSLSLFGQNFDATVFVDRPFDLRGAMGPGVNFLRLAFELPDARVWDVDTPWLYQLQVKVTDEAGGLLDARARTFGMRSFRIDETTEPKGRIFLNGREIRLRGANTMGFEQQCVMKRDWDQLRDDILLAKICHMNFWRITQRPVQEEVYDYCDRLGLMAQTDLPLFGAMRRNQFSEGARQAGEMERLIRGHACSIQVSYINEPFPASWGAFKSWRHLTRPELEAFFQACDLAVRLENPDRAIKAVDGDYDPPGPGLPDNHCYCGWYVGHGVDLGRLHKGYWQRVKPGWMYGCGEFGAEGLDHADLMRRRYPKAWLPGSAEEEATWTPHRIPKAQTGNFHYIWFDTQHGMEAWCRASQAHQARVTRLMTEAFRRNGRMNSIAIHLFIDAFPSGWMKTIMDVERRPKPSYFVYRDALSPLLVSLRSDRRAMFGGEQSAVEVWLCNDLQDSFAGATLAYVAELDGRPCGGGTMRAEIRACDSVFQGWLRIPVPGVTRRGTLVVRAAVIDAAGQPLHSAELTTDVFPRPPAWREAPAVALVGAASGRGAALLKDLGLPGGPSASLTGAGIIVIDDGAALESRRAEIEAAVRQGARALLLELPADAKVTVAGTDVAVRRCGMGRYSFVSRATGHPYVRDFEPEDFAFWYDPAIDCPSPLISATFQAPGWAPILLSGQGGWGADWQPALAAAETTEGAGRWIVCQVQLSGRTAGNPVAEIFARRLLGQALG